MADAPSKKGEPGSVQWFRWYERHWRRSSWFYVVVSIVQVLVLAYASVFDSRFLAVHIGAVGAMVFLAGVRWQSCQHEARVAARHAWECEANAVVASMAQSGIYSFREALEALRDGPLPPGVDRKDWVERHNALIAHVEQDDGP